MLFLNAFLTFFRTHYDPYHTYKILKDYMQSLLIQRGFITVIKHFHFVLWCYMVWYIFSEIHDPKFWRSQCFLFVFFYHKQSKVDNIHSAEFTSYIHTLSVIFFRCIITIFLKRSKLLYFSFEEWVIASFTFQMEIDTILLE